MATTKPASSKMSSRRLHSKLRLVMNGDRVVNAMRAGNSNCLAVTSDAGAALPNHEAKVLRATREAYSLGNVDGNSISPNAKPKKPSKLNKNKLADQSFVNVFIETQQADPSQPSMTAQVEQEIWKIVASSQADRNIAGAIIKRRNFIAATVPVSELESIAAIKGVSFVHSAHSLDFRLPRANARSEALSPSPRSVQMPARVRKQSQVIIGIIDVGGFDFSHPDFLDAGGNTRFISIWDQGGDFRPPPSENIRSMFNYGSEFTSRHLNNAIKNAKASGFPPTLLEKQSQQSMNSHATHVASIAAGNSGVCPDALIAGVLVSVPVPKDEREARRWTFSDESRIIHAIEYLLKIAEREGLPISINISLGTNGGSHDGAGGSSRWIDSALSSPGRAVCVAAGNAGQEKSVTSDDIGWIMGRIHTSGRIPSRGLAVELEWVVVGDGIADVSENEMEIWYGAQDRIVVSVQPPGSSEWYTVEPKEFIENRLLENGTMLSIYSELYHPTNGDNYIAIYLSPYWNPNAYRPVAPGTWKVRLYGEEIRDGRYHAWIERDDPMELERNHELAAYRFPSFFSEKSNVDSHSIGSLSCSHRVVAVANNDEATNSINISSSQGPTRDDRNKPDIAAPGTNIVAAGGFNDERTWVSMTGTSMASPYVCGVIGLMLSVNPSLNAAQCLGILRRTAQPLPSHSYDWRNDAGYGLINPAEALKEAATYDQRTEKK